jgi:hypothetical protein
MAGLSWGPEGQQYQWIHGKLVPAEQPGLDLAGTYQKKFGGVTPLDLSVKVADLGARQPKAVAPSVPSTTVSSAILTRGAAERAPGVGPGGFIPPYEEPGESFPSTGTGARGSGSGGGGGMSSGSLNREGTAQRNLDYKMSQENIASRGSLQSDMIAANQRLQDTALAAQSQREEDAFERRKAFATPYMSQLQGENIPATTEGLSEAERIAIQAQKEATSDDLDRLKDELSGAGILSSGTLAVGTGRILGAARGAIAGKLGEFAESRATRNYNTLIAKRQQLISLIQSILG